MGGYQRERWEPRFEGGGSRDDRRGGAFLAYVPDALVTRPLVVSGALAHKAAEAEAAVRAVSSDIDRPLDGIARFLLRSEAIASSQIEGITPSPQQVALAELAQDEPVKGFGDQARLVANNITVVRTATSDLVARPAVSVSDIVALHAVLLPDERFHGLRSVQNWIGGSNWNPLSAQFIPPVPARVEALMADLVEYLNGSVHAPLVQAALLHAQFETVHPFVDGNGRVGRALIHTVLGRRGLAPRAVLPVSLVLATLSDQYVAGLTAFRHEGDPGSAAGVAAVESWLNVFLDATIIAAEQARLIAQELELLRAEWAQRVADHRATRGLRETPRADSATTRILGVLTKVPVMTTATAQRVLKISFPAARAALEELADAGVLQRKTVERGSTGYLCRNVLDLISFAERRLASTRFDTRVSPPNRPVPALPEGDR
jgi:Fic family protein